MGKEEMPTGMQWSIPRLTYQPLARRQRTAVPAAPPLARVPAAHLHRKGLVSDNFAHHSIGVTAREVDRHAVDAVHKILNQLLGHNPTIEARMAAARVMIFIIPCDHRLTDLEQFEGLKGTMTTDGRKYDDLAGIGGLVLENDQFAVAVPEENLITISGARDIYGSGYSVAMHEIAHAVFTKGLSDDERKAVEALFAEHKKAGLHWTDSYGATNKEEYFAQCTNAYFNENVGIGQSGRAWLKTNDSKMAEFLDRIYGPHTAPSPAGIAGTGGAPRK